jgi:hypothetical protein
MSACPGPATNGVKVVKGQINELPCIATGEPFTLHNGSLSSVRSQAHVANDTGVEVLSGSRKKIK